MAHYLKIILLRSVVLAIFASTIASEALAEDLPGAADAGRVQGDRDRKLPVIGKNVELPERKRSTVLKIPEEAKALSFKLNKVIYEGVTVFDKDELAALDGEYIGKQVTSDVIWIIANKLTERYQKEGYFLSRAYVPGQSIEDGIVKIIAVEGYIGEVEVQGKESDRIINNLTESLKRDRPSHIRMVESNLLLLNDLPGKSFRSILQPLNNDNEGATKLVLISQKKDNQAQLSYDNYGSRYLGPFQASLNYQASLLPYQSTGFSTTVSTPKDELKYFILGHEIALTPRFTLLASGGYTKAHPGYKLEIRDIDSTSTNIDIALKYQLLRQRDQNLSFKLSLDTKNTNSDILQTPLTRDRVRAARLSATYDKTDNWSGYNFLNLTFSHGLDILGSSNEGDLNLSRAEAKPEFDKIEFYISRTQSFSKNLGAVFSASGQYANEPLYSSQEYGYGGQSFGRAYDSSELTGDSGISGALELRYYGFNLNEDFATVPYVFYDIGRVWNRDIGSVPISGSSTGIGVRINSSSGIGANFTIAEPLTKTTDAPQSSHNKDPRYLFQLSYGF